MSALWTGFLWGIFSLFILCVVGQTLTCLVVRWMEQKGSNERK